MSLDTAPANSSNIRLARAELMQPAIGRATNALPYVDIVEVLSKLRRQQYKSYFQQDMASNRFNLNILSSMSNIKTMFWE